MATSKFRVFIVEAIYLSITTIIFLITLSLMIQYSYWYWPLIFFIIGIYLCVFPFGLLMGIGQIKYPNEDPLFGLFIMDDDARNWYFKYYQNTSKSRMKLGIYSIIGYKIKED